MQSVSDAVQGDGGLLDEGVTAGELGRRGACSGGVGVLWTNSIIAADEIPRNYIIYLKRR